VNRAELIDAIRDRLGIEKKTAESAVDAVLDTIQRAVATGERVAISGFGVFEKVDRAARTGRNPRTGETVRVKKTSVPKFRPGSQFKGVVSGAVKLGKVADVGRSAADIAAKSALSQPQVRKAVAGTKAAARSTATTARATAEIASAGPRRAAGAASRAAKNTATTRKTTTKKSAPAKKAASTTRTAKKTTSTAAKKTTRTASSAKKTTASAATSAKKTTAKTASSAKKTTAKKATGAKRAAKKTTS
jgi:DNA-binding protein HU-beta